jgi:hypothetical protein
MKPKRAASWLVALVAIGCSPEATNGDPSPSVGIAKAAATEPQPAEKSAPAKKIPTLLRAETHQGVVPEGQTGNFGVYGAFRNDTGNELANVTIRVVFRDAPGGKELGRQDFVTKELGDQLNDFTGPALPGSVVGFAEYAPVPPNLLAAKDMEVTLVASAVSPPSFLGAVAKGDLAEVERHLKADRSLATQRFGDRQTTAAHVAAAANHPKVLERLKKAGADLRASSNWGEAPVHAAISADAVQAYRYLRSNGVGAGEKDAFDNSLLLSAARCGASNIAALLIAEGADIKAKSREGRTPFQLAVEAGDVATAKLLLSKGAEMGGLNELGYNLMQVAAQSGSSASIRVAHELGFDVSKPAKPGEWTPLMIAMANKNYDAVRELLKLGADPTVKNKRGGTALSLGWPPIPPDIEAALKKKPAP